MDTLLAVLAALNALSPLAVIALLILVLYYALSHNKTTVTKIDALKTNDLHEVLRLLTGINDTLARLEAQYRESDLRQRSDMATLLERWK